MYNIFKLAFFISLLGLAVFFVSYFMNIMDLVKNAEQLQEYNNSDPGYVLKTLFSPAMLTSLVITTIAQLTYIILGIVFVVRNKNIQDTERVLWILGFLLVGFVTAIVFMILNKSRRLVAGGAQQGNDMQ
ncbi:MAG: hypothetical protein KL787_00425 [Taibaiella sp.]|nr:hypothetical protein [Taibaiella sp.]